jgi:hypothetical protein
MRPGFSLRRRLSWGVACSGAAVLGVAFLQPVTPAAQAEDPSAPLAVTGELPDTAASVSVSLVPDLGKLEDGERAEEYQLPEAEYLLDGASFQLLIDPADVPSSYIQDDGILDLAVDGEVQNGTIYRIHTSVRMVAVATEDDGTDRTLSRSGYTVEWRDPVDTSGLVGDDAVERAGTSRSMSSARVPVLAIGDEETTDPEAEDDGTTVSKDEYVEVPEGVDRAMCWYDPVPGVDSRQRSTTIGTTYPTTAGDTAHMVIEESRGADYGQAYMATGSSGGWSANGEKFTRDSWSKTWGNVSAQRSYRKFIEYDMFYFSCRGSSGPIGRFWRPVGETGGTGHNDGINRPNWTYCTRVDAGTWARKSTTGESYKYGAGVKFAGVIGIDLSVDRQYSSDQYIEYQLDGNNQRLCGNSDYPARAGKIMEKGL